MFQEIMEIINGWDPIGIKNITPEDEYSFEAQEIVEFLEKNKNADVVALSKKIDEVFTKWFGSDTYQNYGSKQVAQKILDTKKENYNKVEIYLGENMFFCKLEKLEELEKEQDWNGTISYLDLIWKNDKTNTELLLRLASECWFVLTNYEAMNLEKFKVDYDYVQNKLIETYHYYSEHGKNNKCDLMFGYFMTISAYAFCKTDSDKEYLEIENTGRKLIEKAFKENDCPLNQVVFYGSSLKQNRKQARAKSLLKKEINTIFSKDTEIEKYFLDVLTK